MRFLILLTAFLGLVDLAAAQQQPTPQQQVELLKAELQATREQREAAMNQIASLSIVARSLESALAEAKKTQCKPEPEKKS